MFISSDQLSCRSPFTVQAPANPIPRPVSPSSYNPADSHPTLHYRAVSWASASDSSIYRAFPATLASTSSFHSIVPISRAFHEQNSAFMNDPLVESNGPILAPIATRSNQDIGTLHMESFSAPSPLHSHSPRLLSIVEPQAPPHETLSVDRPRSVEAATPPAFQDDCWEQNENDSIGSTLGCAYSESLIVPLWNSSRPMTSAQVSSQNGLSSPTIVQTPRKEPFKRRRTDDMELNPIRRETPIETDLVEALRLLQVRPNFQGIVSTTNDWGQTLAHLSILYDYPHLLGFLVDWRINLTIADVNGLTALHYAFMKGDLDSVRVLRRGGASETVMDKLGRTPLDLHPEGFGSSTAIDAKAAVEW